MSNLFTSILNSTIIASAVAVAIIFVRLVLKNRLPRRTFVILWLVVLFRLAIPFSIPSPTSLFNAAGTASSGARFELVTAITERIAAAGSKTTSAADTQAVNKTTDTPVKAATSGETATKTNTPASVPPIIWMAGAVLMLMFGATLYVRTGAIIRSAQAIESEQQNIAKDKLKLRRKVRLYACREAETPMAAGIFRPCILFPWETDRSNAQAMEHILTHECVHIKKNDNLIKLLFALALCIHWFNPIVWFCYYLLRADMEAACDEKALALLGEKSGGEYAKTLLDMAQKEQGFTNGAFSAFGESHIKQRIKNIMKYKKTTVIGTVAAVLAVVTAITVLATNPFANQLSAYDAIKQGISGSIGSIAIQAGDSGSSVDMITDRTAIQNICNRLDTWRIRQSKESDSGQEAAYILTFYSGGKTAGTLKIVRAQSDILTINDKGYSPQKPFDYSFLNGIYNQKSPLDISAFEKQYLITDYPASLDQHGVSNFIYNLDAKRTQQYTLINYYKGPGGENTYVLNYLGYDTNLKKAIDTVSFTINNDHGKMELSSVDVRYFTCLYIDGVRKNGYMHSDLPPVVLNNQYSVYLNNGILSMLDVDTLKVVSTVSLGLADREEVVRFRNSGSGVMVVTTKKAVRYDESLKQTGVLNLPKGSMLLHFDKPYFTVWDVSDDLSKLCYEVGDGLYLSDKDMKNPILIKSCDNLTNDDPTLETSYGRAEFVDGSKKILFYNYNQDNLQQTIYLYNINNGVLSFYSAPDSYNITGYYINNQISFYTDTISVGATGFGLFGILDPEQTTTVSQGEVMTEEKTVKLWNNILNCYVEGSSYTNGKIVAFTENICNNSDLNSDSSILFVYNIKTQILKETFIAGGYWTNVFVVTPENNIVLTYDDEVGKKSGAIVYKGE